MTNHPKNKAAPATDRLAIAGFISGLLALLSPALTALWTIFPTIHTSLELHLGHIPFLALFYFSLFGSLPFAIAGLVLGALALWRIRGSREKKGRVLAILALVLGAAELIYSVIILIHWIQILHTPINPLVPV